ncbi:MAG: hypothetical protein IPO83_18145 [Chitinophagaceae bacterium]|nr:hypothetical protein [Chitinophagaceae bacterium]
MNQVRYNYIIPVFFLLFTGYALKAQTFIGYRYDFEKVSASEISVIMDTITEGFVTYVTTYKVFSGTETINKVPIMNIIVTHFPPEKSIEVSVDENKSAKRISATESNPVRFRYSDYGNMIVADRNDTIPYDSTYIFYDAVYFFGDKSKKHFVYLNQIGEKYTQFPDKYILNQIPAYIYKEDSISYQRFKLEGTIEKRYANWKIEYEAFQRDSIRMEDSIRAEQLNEFLMIRKDTFIRASEDTSAIYAVGFKNLARQLGLDFRKTKMKYAGTITVKTDTSGKIISAVPVEISVDSHDFLSFQLRLVKAIEGGSVKPLTRSFHGNKYAMKTQFRISVSVFCDTLLQAIKIERDTLEYEIHNYETEALTQKLSKVITEKGRYTFVLYYSEIEEKKYYYIAHLKGAGKRFGDMVFEE